MKPRKGVPAGAESLWRFLERYSFQVRWKDPCAYVAEIHGALTVRFQKSALPAGYGAIAPGSDSDLVESNMLVNVSSPQSVSDLPRIYASVKADRAKHDGGMIVILVTKWYDDLTHLRALKRQLESLGTGVLIKSTPLPSPRDTARDGVSRRRTK